MNAVAFATLVILLFVCGFVVGYVYKAVDDREVMDADADELAQLRQQVRAQAEELAVLREEYGNYDWIEQELLMKVGQ